MVRLFSLLLASVFFTGCANFAQLKRDLNITDKGHTVIVQITNMPDQKTPVVGLVLRWDRDHKQVTASDHVMVGASGVFAFVVKEPDHQFVMAFADRNRNKRYDPAEPAWIHRRGNKPAAIGFSSNNGKTSLQGSLSKSTRLPHGALEAARRFAGNRPFSATATGHAATMQLGEVVNPNDVRFTSTSGEEGLWSPANFAFQQRLGIYFLDKYDPSKTPVIFVHGAAGSPQDWQDFFRHFDNKHFQPWFYVYPSGGRLEMSAKALDDGINRLHEIYRFNKIHVVAHSMGGLVSRKAVVDNALSNNNRYHMKLVTISTPFGGHEAAEMGVKMAPSVVPSWIDMAPNSPFQRSLFKKSIKGKIQHHMLFSYRGKKSYSLPRSNDGTVSVASQLKPEAQRDAASVHGFNEDHMSILSNEEVIRLVAKLLR